MSYWDDFKNSLIGNIKIPAPSDAAQAVSDKITQALNPVTAAVQNQPAPAPAPAAPSMSVPAPVAAAGIGLSGLVLGGIVLFFIFRKD